MVLRDTVEVACRQHVPCLESYIAKGFAGGPLMGQPDMRLGEVMVDEDGWGSRDPPS